MKMKYLILELYNERYSISSSIEIKEFDCFNDAIDYLDFELEDIEKIDKVNEVLYYKDEYRTEVFNDELDKFIEKVSFHNYFVANIDLNKDFSTMIDLVYLNNKHGILDQKENINLSL